MSVENVGQIMTHNPQVCCPNDTLNRAAQIMWEQDCGCVPIVDDDGKAVGMVTDRDVCMAAYTTGAPLGRIPMSAAASFRLISVLENDSIETAEKCMQAHQVRRIPVLDDKGRPIGIVSMNDLARHVHSGHRHDGLNSEAIAKTLAAVCAPREHAVSAAAAAE